MTKEEAHQRAKHFVMNNWSKPELLTQYIADEFFRLSNAPADWKIEDNEPKTFDCPECGMRNVEVRSDGRLAMHQTKGAHGPSRCGEQRIYFPRKM